jgi:hypothetical protein
VKEDALQEGLAIPEEAVVRERVLGAKVEAPDHATVKDFLRWHAAISQGEIVKEVTSDSLNTTAEWFFTGFSRVTGTPTHGDDRSKVYNVSILHRTWRACSLILISGSERP